MTDTTRTNRITTLSVLPVWVLAVVGAVLVLLLADEHPWAWMLLVLVGSLLLGFVLQLATQTKDGLVTRISAASSGAFVVVLVGAVVLLLR